MSWFCKTLGLSLIEWKKSRLEEPVFDTFVRELLANHQVYSLTFGRRDYWCLYCPFSENWRCRWCSRWPSCPELPTDYIQNLFLKLKDDAFWATWFFTIPQKGSSCILNASKKIIEPNFPCPQFFLCVNFLSSPMSPYTRQRLHFLAIFWWNPSVFFIWEALNYTLDM